MKPGIIIGCMLIVIGIITCRYPQTINMLSRKDIERIGKKKLGYTSLKYLSVSGILLIISSLLFSYFSINENIEIVFMIVFLLASIIILVTKLLLLKK